MKYLLDRKQEIYFVVLYHDEQMIENEDTKKANRFIIFYESLFT